MKYNFLFLLSASGYLYAINKDALSSEWMKKTAAHIQLQPALIVEPCKFLNYPVIRDAKNTQKPECTIIKSEDEKCIRLVFWNKCQNLFTQYTKHKQDDRVTVRRTSTDGRRDSIYATTQENFDLINQEHIDQKQLLIRQCLFMVYRKSEFQKREKI